MTLGNGEVTLADTRQALLNGYVRKTQMYTTDDGVSIEIRQPTVAQRARVMKAGADANGNIENIADMQIAAVTEVCYHPGTGKRIFEATDHEVLSLLPTAIWFDKVAEIAMKLLNNEPAKAGKPSDETASAEASSS